MLKKMNDWDTIEVKEFNESEKLKLGGRMCVIKNVKLFTHNGIEKVSLELDIDEEENKGFYQEKYDARSENAKFWDDGATLSFIAEPTEEKDKSYFKGLIKAIESYNNGYTWNWDEQSLINKKIGVNFSLKEYEGSDGNVYTKPQAYRWVNSKENFKTDFIPKVRTINNEYIDYEQYIKNKELQKDPFKDFGNITEITDSELAF